MLFRRTLLQLVRWKSAVHSVASLPPRIGSSSSYRSHLQHRDHNTKQGQVGQWQRRSGGALPVTDTIYALSTAPGRAAIAIIRISGPACLNIYEALCPNRPLPLPRTATLRKLVEPRQNDSSKDCVLDNNALVLYFPAPNTVTGEDVLELHVHGGPAIVRSILEAIPKCTAPRPHRRSVDESFIRAAEPGEFTKRAFYNGRLDLTQAEALGESLAAETEQQRRLAVLSADSGLSKRYEEWRKMLLYARGELEALIDFSEDQHFDESTAQLVASVAWRVRNLSQQIRTHVQNASRGELLRSGISLALLGAPNAGKSSLLNRIVGREAAIVSAEEGTTRDIVDVTVDIGGWLCRLGDMAGLRSSTPDSLSSSREKVGLIEAEGIRRARARALQSDVVIVLLSIERANDGRPYLALDNEVLHAALDCHVAGKNLVTVINKVDLLHEIQPPPVTLSKVLNLVASQLHMVHPEHIFVISCRAAQDHDTGNVDPGGLQTLLHGLSAVFRSMTSADVGAEVGLLNAERAQAYWAASLSVTDRQKGYLQECAAHLEGFLAEIPSISGTAEGVSHHVDGHDDLIGQVDDSVDIVTTAEHLRFAAICLAKITGKGEGGDIEDVLGVVFEK